MSTNSIYNYNNFLKSYFIKHGFLTLVGRVISMPLAVYFNILLANNLNTTDYGLIGFMVNFVAFSQVISMFGYKEIIIKYLPYYFANKKYLEFGSLIYTSLLTSLIITLFIVIGANVLSGEISYLYKNQDFSVVIPFFSLNLLITILCLNSNSVLVSLKKVWQSNISERTIMNLANCSQLLLLSIMNIPLTIITISIILIIGKSIALIFSLVYSFKYYKRIEFKNFSFTKNLKLSSNLVLSELSLKIIAIVSPFIIGLYLETEEVGFFYAAFLLANFTSFFISITNNLVSNRISNLFHSKNFGEILDLNYKTSLWLGVSGIAIFMFFIIFGKFLLGFWGDQFVLNSYIILLILSLGEVVNCFGGCSGIIIPICNLEKGGMYISYVCCILNVILQFVLIPNYGIKGAAISTGVSVIVYNILKLVVVYTGLRNDKAT